MSVEYLDLADYVGIAAAVTGLDEGLITKVAELDIWPTRRSMRQRRGSATTTSTQTSSTRPLSSLSGLPRIILCPTGNKRVAWVALRYFLVLNEWTWVEPPTVDEAEHAVLSIASGEWDEAQTSAWLRPRIASGDSE